MWPEPSLWYSLEGREEAEEDGEEWLGGVIAVYLGAREFLCLSALGGPQEVDVVWALNWLTPKSDSSSRIDQDHTSKHQIEKIKYTVLARNDICLPLYRGRHLFSGK